MYGLNEKQFHKLFERASKMKGVTGEMMLRLLESRLDNIVYRMGLANTRRAARQLVNHGHITVMVQKLISHHTLVNQETLSLLRKIL